MDCPSFRIASALVARSAVWILIAFLLLIPKGTADPPPGYYDSAEGQTGLHLRSALQQIISSGHTAVSYDEAKALMWGTLDNREGFVRCRYIGEECFTSTPDTVNTNTEHTWPQSRGTDTYPMRSDIHHLFIVDADMNNRRGNLPFGNVAFPDYEEGGSKVQFGFLFEPRDDHKGDCARAILYMDVRYAHLSLVDSGVNLGENQMGYLDALLAWHQLDPVSAEEQTRNDAIYTYQGNRNPFVDRPEFVPALYGGAPEPTPTPAASLDLSGWLVKQFNSTQEFTLPPGTTIPANSFLIITRNMDRAAFEVEWGVLLDPGIPLVNSGGRMPLINGEETYELWNAQGHQVGERTDTAALNAEDGVIVRTETNANTWIDYNSYGSAYPGQEEYSLHGMGVVVTKFGEPADYNGEFLELFYDAGAPRSDWVHFQLY